MDEQIIVDTWWMRLLRVAKYASTLAVLLLSILVMREIFPSSDHSHKFILSIEPQYESTEGEEEICSYLDGTASPKNDNWVDLDTGRRLTSKEFQEMTRQSISNQPIKCGDIKSVEELTRYLDRQYGESMRRAAEEISIKQDKRRYTYDSLIKDLDQGKIRARKIEYGEKWPIAIDIGKGIGVAAVWYLLMHILYKAVLFIVYGHTNVAKRGSLELHS